MFGIDATARAGNAENVSDGDSKYPQCVRLMSSHRVGSIAINRGAGRCIGR
jgi:hypothetical protein